jgi:hypothetical protein
MKSESPKTVAMPVPALDSSYNQRDTARLRGERQFALCLKSPGRGILRYRFRENQADVHPTSTDLCARPLVLQRGPRDSLSWPFTR